MKKFIAMSKEQAKRYTYKNVSEDYIIVSINEPNERYPKFNRTVRLKGVLYLYFEDISELRVGSITISDKDAIDILNFIDKHESVDNVIIHCTAGVSRSVSIRCALEEIYNNRVIGTFVKEEKINPNTIFSIEDLLNDKDDNVYIFNKLCYEKIKSIASQYKNHNTIKE